MVRRQDVDLTTGSRAPRRPWRTAPYSDWNEWLIAHVFEGADASSPIERIAASPEELCAIVGEPHEHAEEVVAAFVRSAKEELDAERLSLLGYCLQYRSKREWWSPRRDEAPYFFAILWLTCLVAFGHPSDEGSFDERMAEAMGKHVSMARVPIASARSTSPPRSSENLEDVWEDLAAWTQGKAGLRKLKLPERDSFRTNIGRSMALAFPTRRDRGRLADVLSDSDLLGFEPPVVLVLAALQRRRTDFSDDFCAELDHFLAFLEKGTDPHSSTFWRAIRQEALSPTVRSVREAQGRTSIGARWDDELLRPMLVCTSDWRAPDGLRIERLDCEDEFDHRVSAPSARETDELVRSVLSQGSHLVGASKRATQQGLLLLRKIASGAYRLCDAAEIAGCDLALVRADRVAAFVRNFGGLEQDSAVDGWSEISTCRVHPVAVLPDGLLDATMLLHTTETQRPRFVGGLRLSPRDLYRIAAYEPRVRAPGAERVRILLPEGPQACSRTGDADWTLPEDLRFDQLTELRVDAMWRVRFGEYEVERSGECWVRLVSATLGFDYKGAPPGDYWLESMSRRLEGLQGPLDEVPLGFCGDALPHVADALTMDASARWLGPGLGEMSLHPGERYPWLAIGPKNRPEMVIFVGDAEHPPLPDDTFSPHRGDRRHWSAAFTDPARIFVRRGAAYSRLADELNIQRVYRAYKAAVTRSPGREHPCSVTQLDTHVADAPFGVTEQSEGAWLFSEILSVLGANRAGISLVEAGEHLAAVMGSMGEDPVLREHVLRSWAECGAIDVLRRVDGRQRIVVVRKPRFVVVRKGPAFVGTVVGLVPRAISDELAREAERRGLSLAWQLAPNRYQLPLARVRAESLAGIEALASALGLPRRELVNWPDPSTVPDALRVRDEIEAGEPPDMYEREASWCWKLLAFRRKPEDPGVVGIERRHHEQRAPIYVVTSNGVATAWSYSRTWALLCAAEKARQPPFEFGSSFLLRARGRSPHHLPLPLARLCAILGIGAPGPELDDQGGVAGYVYPFGRQLGRLVSTTIPRLWLKR